MRRYTREHRDSPRVSTLLLAFQILLVSRPGHLVLVEALPEVWIVDVLTLVYALWRG